ncbi:MAG TPA: DoxX family protein [Candidatus Dormibacteraeota bacterium]|nr:DoxX family protein [Candidatus Dormibacteraeota bacterium]
MHHLEKLKPLAQIALRWTLAIIFIYHGFPELFTERAHFIASFSRMGFPSYAGYIAASLEFFGGCLLALGLLTRPVALLLAVEMGVVIWKVCVAKGLLAVGNYQLDLILLVSAFTLMVIGPGVVSVDRLLFGSNH